MIHAILSLLERTLAGPSHRAHETAHIEAGLLGEEAAEKMMIEKGYAILARRWSTPRQRGDLDLIAWKDGTLVFVEVKTRTARDSAPAEVNVDRKKRRTLRRLARFYLKTFRAQPESVRFDVLSVYLLPKAPPEVEHIQSAFAWSERTHSLE